MRSPSFVIVRTSTFGLSPHFVNEDGRPVITIESKLVNLSGFTSGEKNVS